MALLYAPKKIVVTGILFCFLLYCAPLLTYAGTLTLSPNGRSYEVGTTFSATVVASSADTSFNAVSGILDFPNDLLEVVSVSKSNSVMSLWVVEPTFSNAQGTVAFEGIVLNPGHTGTGKVLTVTFRAKREGKAVVTFRNPAMLANDGNGTDILSTTGNALFELVAQQNTPTAPSVTEDDSLEATDSTAPVVAFAHTPEYGWIADADVQFTFTFDGGVDALRLLLNDITDSMPNVVHAPAVTSRMVTDVPEGISYLHAQTRTDGVWGGITHFAVKRDATPPQEPRITTHHTEGSAVPVVSIWATDVLSGIAKIEVSLDAEPARTLSEGEYAVYVGEHLSPGTHTLHIRVYDKAGNIHESTATLEVPETTLGESPHVVRTVGSIFALSTSTLSVFLFIVSFILIHLLLMMFYMYRRYRAHVHRETKEALVVLADSFTAVVADIEKHTELIVKAQKKQTLTATEKKLYKNLTTTITDARNVITKEIRDIEK